MFCFHFFFVVAVFFVLYFAAVWAQPSHPSIASLLLVAIAEITYWLVIFFVKLTKLRISCFIGFLYCSPVSLTNSPSMHF